MPLNNNHSPIFYGWWVVAGGLLISLYTAGVIHFGFTAVFEPIASEFGWSYAHISLAASLRGLETGLLAPIVGMMVDRWGSRKLVFTGGVISGFGLILLSRINSLGMFYVAFILIAIGLSSCSATVFLAAVANWFRKRIGIATGIMSCGFALGGLLVPLITVLIDTYGWRQSMLGLGLGLWVTVLPLSLLIRHKPEQYGYLPDGAARGPVGADSGPSLPLEVDIPTKQALKSRAFWHISLAFLFQVLVINSVTVHVMPYLSTVGVSRTAASFVATAIPLASIFGRLVFGWFCDRLNKKHVAVFGFILVGLGLFLFALVGTGTMWALLPFLMFLGTGWGSSVTMRVALLRDYFGRAKFGTIHGFTLGVTMAGNIIGPTFVGWAFDKWGTYQGIWLALVSLTAVSAILAATTPPVTGRTKLRDSAAI